MRKSFKSYVVIWIFALALFNVVVFAIPSSIDGKTIIKVVRVATLLKGGLSNIDSDLLGLANYIMSSANKDVILYKYAGAFWPSYLCIIVAFIGQFICSTISFKETNNQKFFYNIPLITISYIGLIFTVAFGTLGMFYPEFPSWLAITVCIVIFVITLTSLIRSNLASTIISDKDKEVEESTAFMKEMTLKTKRIYETNKNDENLKKLYEAFRYSNPVLVNDSNDFKNKIINMLDDIENNQSSTRVKELINYLNGKR